jgi:hypothetical protein
VIAGCRKQHNKLQKLYSTANNVRVIQSRRIRLTRLVARMGEMRNVYIILVGQREGNRPLGGHRYR